LPSFTPFPYTTLFRSLLQVPGIGWDGVRVEHVPTSASIANVAGHEIAVAEYCLAQMLDWCHRLRAADAEFRAGSWARSSRFGGRSEEHTSELQSREKL